MPRPPDRVNDSAELARREARRLGARRFGARWAEHIENEKKSGKDGTSLALHYVMIPAVGAAAGVVAGFLHLSPNAIVNAVWLAALGVVGIRKALPWLQSRRTRNERVIYERPEKRLRK